MPASIIMLVPEEPGRDPRIDWEARAAGEEFDVLVLGINENPEKYKSEESASNYEIRREPWLKNHPDRLSYFIHLFNFIFEPYVRFLALFLIVLFSPLLLSFALVYLLILIIKKMLRFISKVISFIYRRLKMIKVLFKPLNELKNNCIEKVNGSGTTRTTIFSGLREFLWIQIHLYHTTSALLSVYNRSGRKPDLLHCNDLNSLMAGVIIKQKTGCRLVYDAHELWPVSGPYFPSYLISFLKFYERKLIKHVDLTFTVSPDLVEIMKKWYNIENVKLLPNAEIFIESEKLIDTGIRKTANGRMVFLFQGGFAKDRGLEEIIRAWRHIDENKAILCLRGVHWAYSDELKKLAKDQTESGKIFFMPPVTEAELVPASKEGDVGIIPYRPVNLNNKFCCPNKFSQYLQAGVALMVNNLPYMKSLVNEFECGLSYDSDKEETTVEAINRFIADRNFLALCKENAYKAGAETFNWQIQGKPLMDAYRSMINSE